MSLLRILTTPSCWTRIRATNKVLDAWMIEALKNPEFSQLTAHSVFLNGKHIWITNYPYCYGYLYSHQDLGLPSRTTVFKLFDAISNYLVNKQ